MSSMFPAGRYWIGDPCYVIIEGLLWQHHTAYGDGIYEDQKGREYYVDSGTLGITLAKNVKVKLYDHRRGTHIVTIKEPFNASYEDGLFKFGHIEIQTGAQE